MLTLFCLRDDKGDELTLHWYADLVAAAKRIACVSFAFNLDDFFRKILVRDDGVLRYAVFDKNPGKKFEDHIYRIRNTVIAPGAKLEKGDMENFLGEKLAEDTTGTFISTTSSSLSTHWEKTPSSSRAPHQNFSRPSQNANDENMLVIRGNKRVADIYFGEFMRFFDHLYSRYIVRKLKKAGKNDPDAGYSQRRLEGLGAPALKMAPNRCVGNFHGSLKY